MVVTHVEPFATKLVDQLGGVVLASSLGKHSWGPHGPDCVTNTGARTSSPTSPKLLPRHPWRRGAGRPSDQGRHGAGAVGTRWTPASTTGSTRPRSRRRCRRERLEAAFHRRKGGDKGMEIAIADMAHAGLPEDARRRSSTPRLLKQALG